MIIVNDTLYKFTKEKGLFFSHVKDSTYLFDYFKQEEEKERKGNFNTTFKSNPCQMKSMNGGVTRVNSQVSRYIRPANDWCPEEGVSRSRPTPSPLPSFPETSEEEKLQEIINELKECSGSRPVFQNLFGKRFVCRDHFASDRRIKTEFWDQSWHFYKSVGIQTKTQKRTLRVWWASKSDEIHLGINTILLKYNFPQPQINSYSHPQLFPANSFQNPIYLWDGKFKVNVINNSFGTFVDAQLNLPHGRLPFFDFKNKQILNIYIPRLFRIDRYNLNLTTQDITSQSNLKALYKMGIDFLKDELGTLPKNIEFAVVYQKDYDNIEVLYFAERYSRNNNNKAKRTFYTDVGFKIGWVWNDKPSPIFAPDDPNTIIGTDYSGTSRFNIESADDYFRDYTHYELDFYGMARRGDTWRGNRMIR